MLATAIAAAALSTLFAPTHGAARFEPGPAEAAVPERFRLEAATFAYTLRPVRIEPAFVVSELTFPSPIDSPDPVNNVVHAEYFRPRTPGKHPGVVVLHILGADFALSRYLAARLAERGVAALFVRLPYYGERRPEGGDTVPLGRHRAVDPGDAAGDLRRPPGRLAGSAIARRSTPDGSGWPGSASAGSSGRSRPGSTPSWSRRRCSWPAAGWPRSSGRCPRREARRYRDAWIAAGKTLEDLEALTRPFDPLTYADGLRSKRVLMIAGRADEVIPPRAARRLWEAAGRPPIRWYDCGHYSAAGYLLPAIREAVAFFAGPGRGPGPVPVDRFAIRGYPPAISTAHRAATRGWHERQGQQRLPLRLRHPPLDGLLQRGRRRRGPPGPPRGRGRRRSPWSCSGSASSP